MLLGQPLPGISTLRRSSGTDAIETERPAEIPRTQQESLCARRGGLTAIRRTPCERYYQKEIECASRASRSGHGRTSDWSEQVRHVWDNVPYYRAKMETAHVAPDDIKGRDDLYKLPFLSKGRSAGGISVWSSGRAAGRLRPHPLYLRHDRQARRRVLHEGGY